MAPLYLGLVHHPVSNKRGEVVTTSVTNLDIHDIARSCKSFGVERYFIITPLQTQHDLVGRILGHWEEDKASAYNPDRQNALSGAMLAYSIEAAEEKILAETGKKPQLIVTGANFPTFDGDVTLLKEKMRVDNTPYLLIFGTGWGLTASIVDRADFRLKPLLSPYAKEGYNHLSVRSAVAIYLNGLRGSL